MYCETNTITFLHLGQAGDFARHVSGRSALKSSSDIKYILAANRAVPASTPGLSQASGRGLSRPGAVSAASEARQLAGLLLFCVAIAPPRFIANLPTSR